MRIDVEQVLGVIIDDLRDICDEAIHDTVDIPTEQLKIMHDDLREILDNVTEDRARLRAYNNTMKMLKRLMNEA